MQRLPKNFEFGPILDQIRLKIGPQIDWQEYPFSLPIIRNFKALTFPNQVTFFVGENGTGKSTILEAIAIQAGFGYEGGNRNINFKTNNDQSVELLSEQMILSWRLKLTNGYFFRAESFFNLANYIDLISKDQGPEITYKPYGGKSLHVQSHGESFLAFFKTRINQSGLFIFDEPEAALSPQRQLALLSIMHQMCKNPQTQFIIATHSPILLAYPNATIYSCDSHQLTKIAYEDTDHYQLTKNFLNNPARYLNHLFEE